jgi:catechol 2,3-dioxygenase-like lactoylglutathione lyase family enzyme
MGAVSFDGFVTFCEDITATARFYQDGLGLKQDWADEHHVAFALPTKGNPNGAWLLLHPKTNGANVPHELGTFMVDDLDAVVERIRSAGYRIVEEPTDQPWGVRQAAVVDPDGYGLTLTMPKQ